MDTILVVNAGSSSVKFQVFALDGDGLIRRQLKGQVDGIGTLPRLRATGFNGETLADFGYSLERVADVPAALMVAGSWLREEHRVVPIAIGHRVVHGGPDYDRPVLIDHSVVARLERLIPLAPLHQPYNLAPIKTVLASLPEVSQVACFDKAFHRGRDEFGAVEREKCGGCADIVNRDQLARWSLLCALSSNSSNSGMPDAARVASGPGEIA